MLRTYNQFGRRDNIWKARIKILFMISAPRPLPGKWTRSGSATKDGELALDDVVTDIASRFLYPDYQRLDANPPSFAGPPGRPALRYLGQELRRGPRRPATRSSPCRSSLKADAGDATAEQMDGVADLADRYSFGEIRVGARANLVLPHVAQRDLLAVWTALDRSASPRRMSGWCPTSSPARPRLLQPRQRAIDPDRTGDHAPLPQSRSARDLGRLHINISGCINACGHRHIGHIGILGVEKNGEEFYQITLGGKADEHSELGALIGPAVPYAQVADVVEDIAAAYLELRQRPDELFIETVKRTGIEPFKERVYATR